MNKTEAITLVQAAFDADYSAQSFERFVSNLFKGEYTPLDKRRDGHYVREAFRSFVQGYRILGTYQDAEGSSLDILEVTLQRESSLDRARTAQRNFVADYLKKNGKDAALIAFLSPDQHDWRFSLVKLEYSLEVKDGKLKTEEELTPAKRWSFLIGRHEGSHTVQSRFVSLLQDTQKPLLKELEEAFNIESVTDEFFKKYCELFFRMKESLDKLLASDPAIKADFEAKELTTVDFAKKTLGQMAFLYFLQKKGWFGVAPGKPWGTGPKDFLRQLFNRREKYGKNFFDDVLEPLFYEALAQDRGVEAIYPRLNNCRMPFLNGGLFEPMNGYAWETTNIRLPDELFSNSNRTPEGDEGDGILDIFDRYNFTVNESEPLEKEVAVDPEMLGKVFENLLEVKDRKSKGTYYTPREIVHFMCQESLINFLRTELKDTIPREDIEALIRNGSQIIQNDAMVLEKGREGTYKFMLPESIRSRASELDKALANIKVCDPAVGSGAFPLGMLNEIVQARQALAVHLRSDLSPFKLKLHSISHSLYGVDIDPGAVEIAKLRLWLALVVEEDEPHPLPNLEHKVMQGNSLISEYEGVKLFDENFLEEANHLEKERAHVESRLSELQREYFALHSQDALSPVKKEELEREIRSLNKRKKAFSASNGLHGQEISIFDAPGKFQQEQEKAERLQRKIQQFVATSQRSRKQQLKDEIEKIKWDLIEKTLLDQGRSDALADLMQQRTQNVRPFFIWKLEFSDVFKEKGGFDIVLGNPPYVSYGLRGGQKISKEEKSIFRNSYPNSAEYKISMYAMFIDRALQISKNPGGVQSFIVPDSFLLGRYFSKVRATILENNIINMIILLNYKVFNATVGYPVIYNFQKFPPKPKNNKIHLSLVGSNEDLANLNFSSYLLDQEHYNSTPHNRFRVYFNRFDHDLVAKMEGRSDGVLGDYVKGRTGVRSKIGQKNVVSDKNHGETWKRGISSGGYIGRYWVKYKGEFINIDPELLYSGGWDAEVVENKKILIRQTSDKLMAAIDESGLYHLNNVHSFSPKGAKKGSSLPLEVILAFLNSSVMSYYYQIVTLEKGRAMAQTDIETLELLPIVEPGREQQNRIIKLVREISEVSSSGGGENVDNAKIVGLSKELDNEICEIFEVDSKDLEGGNR